MLKINLNKIPKEPNSLLNNFVTLKNSNPYIDEFNYLQKITSKHNYIYFNILILLVFYLFIFIFINIYSFYSFYSNYLYYILYLF